MPPNKLVQKIKNYAIISFILPLIAINSCFFLYKYFGGMSYDLFPNHDWDKTELSYTYDQFIKIQKNLSDYKFTNCPKYEKYTLFNFDNDVSIVDVFANRTKIESLKKNNKIITVSIKSKENLNYFCVKNYPTTYFLLKKFNWLEKTFIKTIQNNPVGFAKEVNRI